MKERILHIDVAKGISICLVAVFHSELKTYFGSVIESMSLFRMPLFFLLSGVFFSWHVGSKDLFLKITEALLKPYFSVLVFILFISYVSGGDAIGWKFKGILYGNGETIRWVPLWFLPHLFAVYIFSYIIFRFCNFQAVPIALKAVALAVILTGGVLCIKFFWYKSFQFFQYSMELPGLPFSIDIVLITSVYFMAGYIVNDKIRRFQPSAVLLGCSIVLFLLVIKYTNAHIDLNKRVYDDPLFASLGALFGIYMVLSCAWAASKLKWLSFVLLRLGESSIYILIFHAPIQAEMHKYFSGKISDENGMVMLAALSFLCSVFIPVGIGWIVRKSELLSIFFLPFKFNPLLRRKLPVRR